MYYLYIRSVTEASKSQVQVFWLFAAPFIVSVCSVILWFNMYKEGNLDNYVRGLLYHDWNVSRQTASVHLAVILDRLVALILTFQMVYVLFKGQRMIVNFHDKLDQYYSEVNERRVNSLFVLLNLFTLLSLIIVVLGVIQRYVFLISWVGYLIPSASMAILLFFMGYLGYKQKFTIAQFEEELERTQKEESQRVHSTMSQSQLHDKLIVLLERDKIYRKKDLRITDVTLALNSNRAYVSRLFNQEIKHSFTDLINHYRIEDAKLMLSDLEYSEETLESIADKVGFTNLSSFYRAFKKEQGDSPGNYRSKQKGDVEELIVCDN